MRRDEAIGTIHYVVDDAGSGRRLGADPHAILRTSGMDFKYESAIVVVTPANKPSIGVVVHSYLDVKMERDESIELAVDYLREIGRITEAGNVEFFAGEATTTPAMSVERLAQQDPREVYHASEEQDTTDDTRQD